MKGTAMKWAVKGLIASCCMSVCCAQTLPRPITIPSGPIPSGLGLNEHNRDESLKVLQLIHATGFRYLRTDIAWSTVEKSAGRYDFSAFDGFVANATSAGLKILFVLDYKNPNYDGGLPPYSPAGDVAFANYAKACVGHFHGKGIIWEIYNEPTGNWATPAYPKLKADSDADIVAPLYAAMANEAGKAIKDAYPSEIVIGPALPWTDSKSPKYWETSVSFLGQILSAGVGSYWDAVSVHPYRTVGPEAAFADMDSLRATIAKSSPGRPLPLVDSEWGYSSTYWDKKDKKDALSYSDAEILKAKRLARAVMVDQMQGIPITIVYDWMNDGMDQNDAEHNFGLVQAQSRSDPDSRLKPLPAFHAISTLTAVLNGCSYVSRVETGDPTDYVVKFTAKSKTVWACWNEKGATHQVTVPIGAFVEVTRTMYDSSSVTALTSGAHGYVCTTSEAPVYLTVGGGALGRTAKH